MPAGDELHRYGEMLKYENRFVSMRPDDFTITRSPWTQLPQRYFVKATGVREWLTNSESTTHMVDAMKKYGGDANCPEFLEVLRTDCLRAAAFGVKFEVNIEDMMRQRAGNLEVTGDAVAAETAYLSNANEPIVEGNRSSRDGEIAFCDDGDTVKWVRATGVIKCATVAHYRAVRERVQTASDLVTMTMSMKRIQERYGEVCGWTVFGSPVLCRTNGVP